MQVTEIKVFPVDEEKLKAFVSIVFDGCFMVNDIKIINGRGGLFISMPSRKKKNGAPVPYTRVQVLKGSNMAVKNF